jgi:hypothetical protein
MQPSPLNIRNMARPDPITHCDRHAPTPDIGASPGRRLFVRKRQIDLEEEGHGRNGLGWLGEARS